MHSLVPAMETFHPQLDHGISIRELNLQAEALGNTASTASDNELLIGVVRIVASVSADGCDAHTGVYPWGTPDLNLHSLPLRLWLFGDDVYIVDALPPYEGLIGSKILKIGERSIGQVKEAVEPIIPRDNDATVRLLMPRYLLTVEVLDGLGLIDGATGPVQLELENGAALTVSDVEPISMADYNDWAGPYGLHLPQDPDVPYLARIDDVLWVDGPNADGEVFFQWNREESASVGDLATALANPEATRLIVDVRHNFGGEVSAIEPVFQTIRAWADDHPGATYLVTGRNTFSAGSLFVAQMDAETDAQIVGEPMGGCPNAWGDAENVPLPYSGIDVSVSTVFNVGADPEDDRQTIEPDVLAPLTVADWAAGVDPAVEAIHALAQ